MLFFKNECIYQKWRILCKININATIMLRYSFNLIISNVHNQANNLLYCCHVIEVDTEYVIKTHYFSTFIFSGELEFYFKIFACNPLLPWRTIFDLSLSHNIIIFCCLLTLISYVYSAVYYISTKIKFNFISNLREFIFWKNLWRFYALY